MSLTYDQAIDTLRNTPATKEALLDLVSKVSVQAEGVVTVLYSGRVADGIHSMDVIDSMRANGENIRVIDKTEAAKLLKSDEFLAKVAEAHNIRFDQITDPEYRGPAKDWLYHGSEGPWAEASGRFIDATVGEVRTLTGNASASGVFSNTELPRALSNSAITHIDNIPHERLQTLGAADALKAVQAQSAIDTLRLNISVDMEGTPLPKNGTLQIDARDYFAHTPGITAHAPQPDTPMRGLASYADPATLSNHSDGARILQGLKADFTAQASLPGADNAVMRASALRALDKLGIAGDILALALVATSANAAYAAGDTARGNQIIRDWALDLGGGLAGGILAAKLVGAALAPLYLAGPAGAIIAGSLTLLAGLAGGIAGGEMAVDMVNRLITTLQQQTALAQTQVIRYDPLTLDLDGDGLETVAGSAGAHFDHDANGFAEQTGWVGKDDGLLVWDRDGNGTIDSGRELFGDQTRLKTGQLAANGFAALAEWDDNGDGRIDAADAIWTKLQIWNDADGDGATDAGELRSLNDHHIQALKHANTVGNVNDGLGNTRTQLGSYSKTDGSTAQMGNYIFARDTARTQATTTLDLGTDIAALPDLAGFGNVHGLRQAMARDGGRLSKVGWCQMRLWAVNAANQENQPLAA